jgi:hypothetical protein
MISKVIMQLKKNLLMRLLQALDVYELAMKY